VKTSSTSRVRLSALAPRALLICLVAALSGAAWTIPAGAASPPSAPRALTVTAGPTLGAVSLSWSTPSNVGVPPLSEYGADVSLNGGPFSAITWFGSTALTANSATFPALTCSTASPGNAGCSYRVYARNTTPATSPPSGTVVAWTTPGVPTHLSSTPLTETTVSVAWQQPTSASGGFPPASLQYEIYGNEDGAGFVLLTTTSAGATSAVVQCKGLVTCAYQVDATFIPSDAPTQDFSGTKANAPTVDAVPGPVSTLRVVDTVNDLGTGVATIAGSWSPPPSGMPFSEYEWQRCTLAPGATLGCGAGGAWSAGTQTSDPSLNDACGPSVATCYYRVRAVRLVDGNPSSGPFRSAFVSPWAPFGVSLEPGPALGQISLSFTGPSETGAGGPKRYDVYECTSGCGSDASWSPAPVSPIAYPAGPGPYAFSCAANTTCQVRVVFVDGTGSTSVASAAVSGLGSALTIDTPSPDVDTSNPVVGGDCTIGYGLVSLVWPPDGGSSHTSACDGFGRWSVTLASDGSADGTGTASATQDGTLSSASVTFTLDTTAPAAPSTPDLTNASDSGASNTDDITKVNTPEFTGTAEDGASVTIYADGTPVGSGVATGGTYDITTSVLSDGVYSMTASQVDVAGNVSGMSGGLSVTIDTVVAAPSTPDLTNASDTGASNTDDITKLNTPTFSGTAEAGSTVTLYEGATVLGSGVATGGVYTITSSALADGVHHVTAQAVDVATNVSPMSGDLAVTIDTTPPTLTVTATGPNVFTDGTTVWWKAGGTGSFTITAADPGSGISTASFPPALTGWTRTLGTNSATYTRTGTPVTSTSLGASSATNVAGVSASLPSVTITRDSTTPAVAFTFPVTGGLYNSASWAAGCSPAGLCGTASDIPSGLAHVEVTASRSSDGRFWNGSTWQVGTFTLVASGTTSWVQPLAPANLIDDTYTVTAQSVDNVGNVSLLRTRSFTYDNTGPAVAITSMSNGGGTSRVTVNGTGSTGANDGRVTVYLCHTTPCNAGNAVATANPTVSAGGTWTFTTGNIGLGTYYATAVRTDTAGNTTTFNNFGPFVR
jgi:hypothetical protein